MENMIAIITARGGSKRIPKKNIKEFMGKPMIAYAIDAAEKSGLFETIMVSTDDNEIAKVARSYGADVPFMRSERTASDFATTWDVIEEVIGEYDSLDRHFDNVCCIYPCAPFLTAESLIAASMLLEKENIDSVMPVCHYPAPIEWAFEIKNDILVANDFEKTLIRSQDLTPKYYDVGMFYFSRTKAAFAAHTLITPRTAPYIIDERECRDIDTMDDWNMAELKYKMIHMEDV